MSLDLLDRPANNVAGASLAQPLPADPASARRPISEFLAFKVGGEEYGVDILRVQEIRSYEKPTRLASAPRHVLGVVNLRGVIVPVIDLRLQFGLAEPRYDALTVVIVLTVGGRVIGAVVDGVNDVINLDAEQMRPVPALEASSGSNHLMAIGTFDERMVLLLDIERVLAGADVGRLTTG
jgi:purine-binding chemotaxis protein CheW